MDKRKLLQIFGSTFVLLYLIWYIGQTSLYLFTHFCVVGFLVLISWTTAYAVYDHLNTETVRPGGKAVLITGCDTGFGHELTLKLDKLGYNVWAGVMFPDGEGAKKLKQNCSARLRVTQMDVTKQEDVQRVVRDIEQSRDSLWAVVNNAGIGYGAFADWGNDVQPFQRMLDVNLLGVIRVTKYCMPLLRESKGRIVNVASVLGRITLPNLSHYAIAKHGVRVYSDALRREFLFNNDQIEVVTIEPTFFQTAIVDKAEIKRIRRRFFDESPEEIKRGYDHKTVEEIFDKGERTIDRITSRNIGKVVNAMANGVTLKRPKQFYRCSSYLEVITFWALSHAPEFVVDYVLTNVAA